MNYSYDRTAAEKIWHDLFQEAATKFCVDTLKAVVKQLKGKGAIREGSFGSATGMVQIGEESVKLSMGFRGGSVGSVYFEAVGSRVFKESDIGVTAHTPSSFAILVANALHRAGWNVPAA